MYIIQVALKVVPYDCKTKAAHGSNGKWSCVIVSLLRQSQPLPLAGAPSGSGLPGGIGGFILSIAGGNFLCCASSVRWSHSKDSTAQYHFSFHCKCSRYGKKLFFLFSFHLCDVNSAGKVSNQLTAVVYQREVHHDATDVGVAVKINAIMYLVSFI